MNHLSQDKKCLEHHAGWGNYPGITALFPEKRVGTATGPSYKQKKKKRRGSGGNKPIYDYYLYEGDKLLIKGTKAQVAERATVTIKTIANSIYRGGKVNGRYTVTKELKDGKTRS